MPTNDALDDDSLELLYAHIAKRCAERSDDASDEGWGSYVADLLIGSGFRWCGDDVELGRTYRDTVTGAIGTATQRLASLGETARVKLETLEAGGPAHAWFPEGRLELLE